MKRVRPWFLVAAMLVTLLVGLRGASNGCGTVAYLRAGAMPDEAAALDEAARDPGHALLILDESAQLRALAEARRVTFPLGVAEAIVSALLILMSAGVLVGRPGAPRLARQVLAVAAALSIATFVLTYPMQAQYVESLRRTAAQAELPRWASWFLPMTPYKALIRMLALQLVPLGLAALALRAERSRAFFEEARVVDERPIDDEDEL
ncbi:MAG: hypothetical protein U0414_36525 [Polyangiaceae bacterium]